MDFFTVNRKENKGGVVTLYPNFLTKRSSDLMIKGKNFYAVWDEERGLWSQDEYDVQRLVDDELWKAKNESKEELNLALMLNFESGSWSQFIQYTQKLGDSAKPLDEKLIFANQETSREDYATKKLPYPLDKEGSCPSWDTLVSTLYKPEDRRKIEWAIGSIISGESKYIQKFLVFYGPSGTGKSTILNIIQKLFAGYIAMFDAKALGSSNNAFSTEVFKSNPLVAIQHDGDLSRIEDNTKLNSIISHEDMVVNEKFKASYTARFNAFLFMGTNQPVKISDAKSGLIRRLIDVEPSGEKLDFDIYQSCMSKIDFELGAIAHHCHEVYKTLGRNYYDDYRPIEMMYKTDHVLNFVSDHYDIFSSQEYVTVKQAYSMYKEFCAEFGIERPMSRQRFQSELGNYFDEFHDRYASSEGLIRAAFTGFDMEKVMPKSFERSKAPIIDLREQASIFDEEMAECPAQLAKEDGTPRYRWDNVRTTLSDIDTRELHYVKTPTNHIIIDFDIKDSDGNKNLEANLDAARDWPSTYTEVSKSGQGLHLHYWYDGDVDILDPNYADGIEVKVYKGKSSLRRKLYLCNNLSFARISSGLPTKEKKVTTTEEQVVKSEKSLRSLIERNLRKEIHPGTKPSVEFIKKILDDAYSSGLEYDVTDLRGKILMFAQGSTNHAVPMMNLVREMKFKSEDKKADIPAKTPDKGKDDRLVFFDVEVYPNLFVVVWKFQGDSDPVRMINPSPQEIEQLFSLKLVGFNNRRYDNHILYGRYMGYDNEALYKLSQKIVNNDRQATFGGAYNISYADIYDFSSKKQGLKKFEIELGINHVEMEIPWDEPVADNMVDNVVEYCVNDVLATEAVFEARKADFTARQILADLSGLTVNDTTQKHTAQIIFEGDREASKQFVYTDLAEDFPGYVFDSGKSYYREETVGEGGYVYAEPGLYSNVAVLDIASMHPTSIEQLNLFGKYTDNFVDLKKARVAIKHGDYDKARGMLDGKLKPYLADDKDAKELSYALKIVINIVYGLTSAKFDNPFRDLRNKDNIVAKRGALFMIDLKNAVQEQGFKVIHIKTDSIKIPDATPEIIQFVTDFGAKYGYDFEHESTYDKICLVNDAVYIAREGDHWEAVGAQFQHPYVFKKLFSGEEITFDDYCETKEVKQGAIYIDLDYEKPMALDDQERMIFVGRTGRFTPVVEGYDGGVLYRVKDGKAYAVTGTKGYLWAKSIAAESYDMEAVDTSYADRLVYEAKKKINEFGDFEELFK